MTKLVLTVCRTPSWMEDAYGHIEVQLNEEYDDGNTVNEMADESEWGQDPCLALEAKQSNL